MADRVGTRGGVERPSFGMVRRSGVDVNVGPVNPPSPRSQAATAWGILSRSLAGISQEAGQRWDREVANEATDKGVMDAINGTVRRLDRSTTRGAAYMDAAVSTMGTIMGTDALVHLTEIYRDNPDNPAAIQAGAEAYGEGLIGRMMAVDPAGAVRLRARMVTQAIPMVNGAIANREQAMAAATKAAREQAEIIEQASIAQNAAGVFSEDPQQASASLGAVTAAHSNVSRFQSTDAAESFLLNRLSSGHPAAYIVNMQEPLKVRLAAMISAAPPEIQAGLGIGSGFRGSAKQEQLYIRSGGRQLPSGEWVGGSGNVARPGHSQHETGGAADITFNGHFLGAAEVPQSVRDWAHDHAGEFGLKFPLLHMAAEQHHIELQETRGGEAWTGEFPAPAEEAARSGGSRSWRNNNPGNLKFTSATEALGAIAQDDDGFAVFANEGAGAAAMESLLFESDAYSNLTVGGAINRWAPPSENESSDYAAQVADAVGVSSDTALEDLSPDQRNTMLYAMRRRERWEPGQGGGVPTPGAPFATFDQDFKDSVVGGGFMAWFQDQTDQTQAYFDFLNGDTELTTYLRDGTPVKVNVRNNLSGERVAEIEGQLRERLRFSNQVNEERERQEAAAAAAVSATTRAGVFTGILLNGQELTNPQTGEKFTARAPTPDALFAAHARGDLSTDDYEVLLKALTVERPNVSNEDVKWEALRMIEAGTDPTMYLFDNQDQLSTTDARTLIDYYETRAGNGGALNNEQKFFFDRLQAVFDQEVSVMGGMDFDPDRAERAEDALIEYRSRVLEGEVPEAVYNELEKRGRISINDPRIMSLTATEMLPRFSVPSLELPGQIDIGATLQALEAAHAANEISDRELSRQYDLLDRWQALQDQMARDAAAVPNAP